MEYIKRHAETTVEKLSKMFGAILVADYATGRQDDHAKKNHE